MTNTPGPAPGAALAEEVRRFTAGGPYEVRPTGYGFDVELTAVDARWTTLMFRNRLRRAVVHQVRVDDARRRYSVTDRTVDVEWQAGVELGGGVPRPRFRYAKEVTSGRSWGISRGKQFGLRDDGTVGVAAEWEYRVGEGRELVRRAAGEQGWTEQVGRDQKIGLIAAGIGLAIALLVIVIVGLVLLGG